MKKLVWGVLILLFGAHLQIHAQDSLVEQKITGQKDIKDFFSDRKSEPKFKKVQFSWSPGAGYTLQTGFAVALGANFAFHTNEDQDSKLSSVSANFIYSQYHQTIVPILASIWSKNGLWNHVSDIRFMQYPSQTWGLAGRRDPNDGYTINFSYLKLHQTLLRAIGNNLYIGTGIFYDHIWNIQEVSAPANGSTNFQRFGLGTEEIAVAAPIRLLYDSRRNQLNPTKGWYVNLTWRENLQSLGSNRNWQSLVLDVRKYIPVSKSGNTLAFWFYSWQSSLRTPYLLLPSTGWDDSFNTGRGYIQGRFRSNIMEYLEAEYRFRITRNGFLGGVVFANMQAFKRRFETGPLVTAPAAGAGLRIKLNKYSGANLCIDYGVGQDGSRGFFLNLGEVF